MNLFDDPEFRLDKSAFSIGRLEDQGNDLEYWLTKTPIERLKVVEFLRQLNYGYDATAARLQRPVEVTWVKRG